MKKQLQLIGYTVFMILVGFACYGQQVGDAFTSSNIIYQVTALNPTNTVMIVGYEGTATSINIPENVTSPQANDFKVTSIGEGAFASNNLTSITIPNSVTSIGMNAFRGNQLDSITIPGSVTSIGEGAFAVNQLTSITIPDGVQSIGGGALCHNKNLDEVVVESIVPPLINKGITLDPFNDADRNQIDLIVPEGKEDVYKTAGWTGFRTVNNVLSLNKTNNPNYVTVYPNPVQDYINIRLKDGEALQQVNLYNTQGAHVYSARTSQIDISHLPSGMYILEIITKTGSKAVKRIIIE